MNRVLLVTIAVIASTALSQAWAAEGNADRGQRVYNACAPCHSLEPNRSMTGPSLAEVWNRKAGGLPSFARYEAPEPRENGYLGERLLPQWLLELGERTVWDGRVALAGWTGHYFLSWRPRLAAARRRVTTG